MDIDAVRTFVAVADTGQFQHAAADLEISQQAVSKRVAALERDLGARLFTRTPRGAQLTADGRALLPHARDLLRAAERAVSAVRPGRRPLKVDVIGKHLAPAVLLRAFHRAHPAADLEVVTLYDGASALAAVASGAVDATFRAVAATPRALPDGVRATRVYDEPLELLTGPAHPLAAARDLTPAALAGHRIWMPSVVAGTEWATYYRDLAAAFGLTLDSTGPDFGVEPLLDAISGTAALATLVGERTQLATPPGSGLRRIALRGPTPVYPHSLAWRGDNPHPALAALRAHLAAPRTGRGEVWTPAWAG